MNQIQLNSFQEKVLLIPEEYDLFLGGGRGGGKSYCLALLCLRHIEQYGGRARILYLRKTYKGLADFELICRELFGLVYGTAARYNASEHVWRFPNGGVIELGQLETQTDYTKYQGRSFTLMMVDEAGQFSNSDLIDIMRSNIRGPKNVVCRMIISANPGGVGHYWLAKRYVFKRGPWSPFLEQNSQKDWLYAPSVFEENSFIDRDSYRAQLQSACPNDPELLRAWVEGDWAVNRGAYFASVLEESRNAVDPWKSIPGDWDTYLAHDFGSTAPSATYLIARSNGGYGPDGRYYPIDSLVAVDELATVNRDNANIGLGWTVPVLAEEIKSMCVKWGVAPKGVADDAIFAHTGHGTGSIADEFRMHGVSFRPAKKADRVTGWNVMRRLLSHAGEPDVPGLYISRSCEYFWETVPTLAGDQKRIEDLDTTGPDHAADAIRYGCMPLREAMSINLKMVI